jgi:hypothetical protein
MVQRLFTAEILTGAYQFNYLQLFTLFGPPQAQCQVAQFSFPRPSAQLLSSSSSTNTQPRHLPLQNLLHPSPAMQRLKLADDLYHTGASLTGGAGATFRSHARAVPLRVALHITGMRGRSIVKAQRHLLKN